MSSEIEISEKASLHALGFALSRCEDIDISNKMMDIKESPSKKARDVKIRIRRPLLKKKGTKSSRKRLMKEKMGHMRSLKQADKHRISLSDCMRPEVLAETLRKPERVYNRAFKGIPKLNGRVAWSLPVYREKVNEKLS